jgi:hypothetical protein
MRKYFVIMIALIILISVLPASSFARDVSSVNRSVSDSTNSAGEYEVKVEIGAVLPVVAGISETLPDGYSFVRSSLPVEQYSATGNEVVFSVINATEFKYYVKGPASGKTGFTGHWTDMLSENQGDVVYAGQSGTTTTTGGNSGNSDTGSSTPGFEAFLALTSITAGIFLFGRRRSG